MRISIGLTVGLIVLVVLVTGFSVWIATLFDGVDTALDIAAQLRRQSSGRATDLLTTRLIAAEKITKSSARYFSRGLYPPTPDAAVPLGSEVNATIKLMLASLQASHMVTTISWTDWRGNLFGVFTDAQFTQYGMWDSYANSAGEPVLRTFDLGAEGTADEATPVKLIDVTVPYNSSEQVWYTVIDTASAASEAWTPIYTMGDTGGVNVMLSHSRTILREDASLIGVTSIDMALGFVNDMLHPPVDAFSFCVDVLNLNGTVIGVSDRTRQSLQRCPVARAADGTCPETEEFVRPSDSADADIRRVDDYVRETFGGWDLINTDDATGRQLLFEVDGYFVTIETLKRTKLRWEIVTVIPRSALLARMDSNVLKMVAVVVVASIVQLALCVFVGLTIRRSFTSISDGIAGLERLEVDDSLAALADTEQDLSFFSEVARLQTGSRRLNRNIKQIRPYVPGSLLLQIQLQEREDEQNAGDAESERSVSCGHTSVARSTNPSARSTNPSSARSRGSTGRSAGASGKIGAAVPLHFAHFNAGTSARVVTVMSVGVKGFHGKTHSMAPGQLAALIDRLVTSVVSTAAESKGVLDYFQGDHFILSFNAVTPSPNHVQNAAVAAYHLASSDREHMTVGFASGRCMVGNMGSDVVKRFNIVGPAYTQACVLERMTKLYKGCRTLTTHSVLTTAAHSITYDLVDVVPLPHVSSGAPVVIGTVTSERDAEQDDEWMYVTTAAPEHEAFLRAAKGDSPAPAPAADAAGAPDANPQYEATVENTRRIAASGLGNKYVNACGDYYAVAVMSTRATIPEQ